MPNQIGAKNIYYIPIAFNNPIINRNNKYIVSIHTTTEKFENSIFLREYEWLGREI